MRYFVLIAILFASCATKEPKPSEQTVYTGDPALHNSNGVWLYHEKPFDGFVIEKSGETVISKLPVRKGKEDGVAYGWYPDGNKRYRREFSKGDREGTHKGWHENGTQAFVFHFHKDKFEGEQLSWFPNGQQWQGLNYNEGKEEGKQRSWNDSGRLINNFTVKNGKLYGVIGRYDCMSVGHK